MIREAKEEKLKEKSRKGLLVSSVWAQELPPSLFGKIKIPLAVQMFCSTVTVAANFNRAESSPLFLESSRVRVWLLDSIEFESDRI